MKTVKFVLGILLIFAVGALSGTVITQYHYQKRFVRMVAMERQDPDRPHRLLRRLEKELDLSDTPRRTIEQLLQQSHEKMRELRRQHRPQVKKIFQETIAIIREELDPKQKRKLGKILKRIRPRGPHNFPVHRPPGPPERSHP